jgi:hypothetical protein
MKAEPKKVVEFSQYNVGSAQEQMSPKRSNFISYLGQKDPNYNHRQLHSGRQYLTIFRNFDKVICKTQGGPILNKLYLNRLLNGGAFMMFLSGFFNMDLLIQSQGFPGKIFFTNLALGIYITG